MATQHPQLLILKLKWFGVQVSRKVYAAGRCMQLEGKVRWKLSGARGTQEEFA